ncbi:ribosomal S29 subunit [Acanthamoeba castellanii str. Neff]|uniref:Ribosomal S29 subunit n=1 Tax=Acanthamoeba castellanii (strain ATCC 30010 / Neff) TaxID=1257118 RepID=L8GYR9_ACACF|nr:ribosomal S29 subunit [Acanthamoeba castellanii str. Neff]ELR17678.1 ribosomal S29 subunit [Acanthamoeba castellanii str. Neff]
MGHAAVWNSHPRKFGPDARSCRRCGNNHGLIRKYGLMMCRRCFRERAEEIGFLKVCLYRFLVLITCSHRLFPSPIRADEVNAHSCPNKPTILSWPRMPKMSPRI